MNPNPSAWNRRIPVVVIALVDCVIASYLALYQSGRLESVWDPAFGAQSHAVLESAFSRAFRQWLYFPDAAWGAVAYLSEAVLGLVGSTRRWRTHPGLVLLFGINAAGVAMVGLVLVAMQAFVIHAWCLLCIATAVLSVVMFLMVWPEVRLSSVVVIRSWKK